MPEGWLCCIGKTVAQFASPSHRIKRRSGTTGSQSALLRSFRIEHEALLLADHAHDSKPLIVAEAVSAPSFLRGKANEQNSYRPSGKSRQSNSIAACAALESDMTHISGFERSQLLLLPEAIDDYVVADNPVRFIDAFVDGPDLAAAGFKRVTPKVTGRPGYAPGDLLKLYIYGYLNRVRSSRRLEAECHRNIEVIWLLRSLKPDFKTIADFRSGNFLKAVRCR